MAAPGLGIMVDFVEFYVPSNPILRPNGVKYVLDQLKESKIEVCTVTQQHPPYYVQSTLTSLHSAARFSTSLPVPGFNAPLRT
ncbi:hypothetical protein IMZ48_18425 [Candidatus Bathyarchaeota archaeon]|nr:hypothetical protein [Candidatus Bathyarchaeota archaeon]